MNTSTFNWIVYSKEGDLYRKFKEFYCPEEAIPVGELDEREEN